MIHRPYGKHSARRAMTPDQILEHEKAVSEGKKIKAARAKKRHAVLKKLLDTRVQATKAGAKENAKAKEN